MPITEQEAKEAIALYDTAMTGDIQALCQVVELYTRAICGDYNAEGIAYAIATEMEKRSHKNARKQQSNRSVSKNKTKQADGN